MAHHNDFAVKAYVPHIPPSEIWTCQAHLLEEEQRGTLGKCSKREESNIEKTEV